MNAAARFALDMSHLLDKIDGLPEDIYMEAERGPDGRSIIRIELPGFLKADMDRIGLQFDRVPTLWRRNRCNRHAEWHVIADVDGFRVDLRAAATVYEENTEVQRLTATGEGGGI